MLYLYMSFSTHYKGWYSGKMRVLVEKWRLFIWKVGPKYKRLFLPFWSVTYVAITHMPWGLVAWIPWPFFHIYALCKCSVSNPHVSSSWQMSRCALMPRLFTFCRCLTRSKCRIGPYTRIRAKACNDASCRRWYLALYIQVKCYHQHDACVQTACPMWK